eukprot:NODE_36_length_36011_cov_1.012920.p6 type:complete len:529 gc:universal NODE_36_length_36011_cov_1.012920:19502-17916(-)
MNIQNFSMSHLSLDSFNLDFIDNDNISILIPPDEEIEESDKINELIVSDTVNGHVNSQLNDFDLNAIIDQIPQERSNIRQNSLLDKIKTLKKTNESAPPSPNRETVNHFQFPYPAEQLVEAPNENNNENLENNETLNESSYHSISSLSNILDMNPSHFHNILNQLIDPYSKDNEINMQQINDEIRNLQVTINNNSRKQSRIEKNKAIVPDELDRKAPEISNLNIKKTIDIAQITTLDLSNHDHNELNLSEYVNCKTLNVAHNHLQSIKLPPNVIECNLNHNMLVDLLFIKETKTLCRLLINFNQVQILNGKEYPHLKELVIHDNQIHSIANMNMRLLDIGHQHTPHIVLNFIKCISFKSIHNKLKNKHHLQITNELQLRQSHLKRISSKGISNLMPLTQLDISYNNISDIVPLYQLHSLCKLNLSGNRIKSFKMILGLRFIKDLDLRYNILNATYYPPNNGTNYDDEGLQHENQSHENDVVHIQKMIYRASMMIDSKVEILDGIAITDKDRKHSRDVLMKIKGFSKHR